MTPLALAHAIDQLRDELEARSHEVGAFDTPPLALDRILAAARRVVRVHDDLKQEGRSG